MRTRKLLEVLAFLVTLGAAYALWFVPMNIVQELLTLAVGLGAVSYTHLGGLHRQGVLRGSSLPPHSRGRPGFCLDAGGTAPPGAEAGGQRGGAPGVYL